MATKKHPQSNNRIPTAEDRKRAHQRAIEWREFRKNYLFSQRVLGECLHCGRRTITAIENEETLWPSLDLLHRFRDLQQAEMLKMRQFEEAVA